MTPLQLEDSFFTVLEARANAAFQPPEEGAQALRAAVKPRLEVARLKTEQKRYQLTLAVESSPDSEKDEPYHIHFEVVGRLLVDESFECEDLDRLVAVNGASILYSSLREMVLIVTGRGAWGAVQLPTVNFSRLDLEGSE